MLTEKTGNKLEALRRTCSLIARVRRVKEGGRPSEVKYYQMMASYYDRIVRAKEEGKLIAAHTVFFPSELLYAMDIVPMHTEMTSWLVAQLLSEQAELLAAGAALGLAPEICSPHRGLAGAFSVKALPRPDVMLWSNLVCDNTAKCGELVMELNGCPGFFLDHPFQTSEAERGYLLGELKELVRFLEEKSGHKMDWDKLSEIVARTDRELELYREIAELRKAVPSPFPFLGFLELISADYFFPGQLEALDYLQTVRDELREMVAQKKGAVPRERFRLLTLFIPPVFLVSFLERLSQELGFVSVAEPFFNLWTEGRLDPARPLESVARKADLIPERRSMYGPLEERTLKEIVQCARDYRVDGVVYWAFMGCRHTCATVKLFKDAFSEIDIPVLTIDCDLVDPTITSKEEVGQKLEQFLELLEDRR